MSGDVVNLRQARKSRTRTGTEKTAEQNRLTFGRSKVEKNLSRALNEKARNALDQSRLDPQSRLDLKAPGDGMGPEDT